jgi:Activator of Hsp90 ATPase homolog 1-like protein
MSDVAPIRREITVSTTAERAFDLFTAGIGNWWPLAGFSVFGDGDGVVAFEDGELVERSGDRRSVWAEVTHWEPPHSFALSWHAGSSVEQATDVRVTFTAVGDKTRVRIEHDGWHRRPEPEAAAREYGHGWPVILETFAQSVPATPTRPLPSGPGG